VLIDFIEGKKAVNRSQLTQAPECAKVELVGREFSEGEGVLIITGGMALFAIFASFSISRVI